MILLKSRVPRKRAVLALTLALGLLLTGCATVPPQQIGGTPTQTAAPTETPSGPADPVETPVSSPGSETEEETGEEDAQVVLAPGTDRPLTLSPSTDRGVAPGKVEVYYSGAPSMMGFADAYGSTIYEDAMEALAACVSLSWPSAQVDYFRYYQDIPKEGMLHPKETLMAYIGNQSFYRDDPMTEQPPRIKWGDEPARMVSEKMNEPIASFYELAGLEKPWSKSNSVGMPIALERSDPEALRVFVTDLHELRADDGTLISSLNQSALSSGHAVGLVAIVSEFSGYIPDVGANRTTYVWGAPPNGTLDMMLDFGEYQVGISIDPETREMASRPFYVLCIGDQAAVGEYVQSLTDRLMREFQGNDTFRMETALFGSSYVPVGYGLAGNASFLGGQGVTAIPDANAPAGVSLVELKASQQVRYLEWDLRYDLHPADPRGARIAATDFHFEAAALSGTGTTALSGLTWSIVESSAQAVTLRLRLEFPQGVIKSGAYSLEISGSLAAPAALPGSAWVDSLGWDADGSQLLNMEQNLAPFDGSRTLFLSRLMDALGTANLNRLGGAPLGKLVLQLTVYA